MPVPARKPQLIAVDTNVLLDRAADQDLVLDALDTVRQRLPVSEFIITPTVVEELVLKVEKGDTQLDRRPVDQVEFSSDEFRSRSSWHRGGNRA